ncbi:agouti-related protein [Denticeps clupeoides]|uniref:Agouti-related protein n=1 Tax=Denticeps clupeoides TaxID=299321 RepID=A0AAY4F0X9_9TELE|nr:agouti-related protein-like [Denticeps clupeoides]
MLNSVILCWWIVTVSLLPLCTARTNHVEDSHPSLRRIKASFLPDIGKEPLSRIDPLHFALETVEEELFEDPGSYDEFPQDVGQPVQLQSRSTRAPRRCIPHQQSCLGHQFPCCDACDTCYCRFFKAFCYCRNMDPTCTHGHA